jgi:hypothetical protein
VVWQGLEVIIDDMGVVKKGEDEVIILGGPQTYASTRKQKLL